MAKKKTMVSAASPGKTCSPCPKGCMVWWGVLLAVIGLLFLGKDLGWAWTSWWNVSWWSIAFLLLACKKLCCAWK